MSYRYIFVSGGVISGLGKGIIAASVSLLLQAEGLKTCPIKCENYLNLDAGTINPIEHGDPFLCDDGTEADMDIGTYEKFLDKDLGKSNFITLGQIYKTVIDRERKFLYRGEDVEAIPYITDEIQKRWREALKKSKTKIAVVELGGTAGEYQNILYYEAARILSLKENAKVVHIHVGYMPVPPHLGEPKTKPIQFSVRTLNSMGIRPDFLMVRSQLAIDQRRKERLALFCNINKTDIISAPDCQSVYELPLIMEKQNLTKKLIKKLGLEPTINKDKNYLVQWRKLIKRIKKANRLPHELKVAIVGKYFKTGKYELKDSYAALFDALYHAAWQNNLNLKILMINAEKVEKYGPAKYLKNVDGIIVPIGWGPRGAEGMIKAADYARRQKIPYLGLCYGMQLAVIAFARSIIGWSDANTTENDQKTFHPVIHLMPAQKKFMARRAYGGTMRLGAWKARIKKGTIAWSIYKKTIVSERHRHRYEFNDQYVKEFLEKGMIISARSLKENLAEIVELPKTIHPFYFAIQGHPEYKSRPLRPHPIFLAYLRSCAQRANAKT